MSRKYVDWGQPGMNMLADDDKDYNEPDEPIILIDDAGEAYYLTDSGERVYVDDPQ